jgi:hypothetical protein
MATVTDKNIVRRMLRNNGVYVGACGPDPQVYSISRYSTPEGGEAFHLGLNGMEELMEATASPFVRNLVVLWTRNHGLTVEGRKLAGIPNGFQVILTKLASKAEYVYSSEDGFTDAEIAAVELEKLLDFLAVNWRDSMEVRIDPPAVAEE